MGDLPFAFKKHGHAYAENRVSGGHVDGRVKFYSATYRLFKLSSLEPDCEDYGQSVIYKGTAGETQKYAFKLDDHHVFLKGKVSLVCGNSWKMLHDTRFKEHFEFIGPSFIDFNEIIIEEFDNDFMILLG